MIKYKSGLEVTCKRALEKNKIPVHYEKVKIPLLPSFEYPENSWEKIGKNYKPQRSRVQDLVYTPDFTSHDSLDKIEWVIETKGFIRPKDRIIWKLFKKWLVDNNYNWVLYKPSNQKEVEETIKIIKNEKTS